MKKPTPVEVIHAEFDSAEARILDQCAALLKELQIPTEDQVVKKGKLLRELGFVNSETVKKAAELEEHTNEILRSRAAKEALAKRIAEYKMFYPLDKFITVEELDRICNKYDLIHAPAANYTKDIPEKNVLEMKNAKPVFKGGDINIMVSSPIDAVDMYHEKKHFDSHVADNDVYWSYTGMCSKEATKKQVAEMRAGINIARIDEHTINFYKRQGYEYSLVSPHILSHAVFGQNLVEQSRASTFTTVDKSGLFIAAPKSHFNLDGLSKKSKFGFFPTTVIEPKDPVVFQYLKGDIIRIISKWGDSSDRAYLDPTLTNETQN